MNPNCAPTVDRKVCSDYSVESLVSCSRKRRNSDFIDEEPADKRAKTLEDNESRDLPKILEDKPKTSQKSLETTEEHQVRIGKPTNTNITSEGRCINQQLNDGKGKIKKRYDPRYPLPEKPRQKRAVIQDMVRPLKKWLLRHRHNPYPTKSEKVQLAIGSNMSLVQVSNWFANARRRLKNVVQDQHSSWSRRLRLYNQYVQGNAEMLSISSNDSIWNSDDEAEDGKARSRIRTDSKDRDDENGSSDVNVVDDKDDDDCDSKSLDQQLTSQYKKSILHRYLADSVDNLPKTPWHEIQNVSCGYQDPQEDQESAKEVQPPKRPRGISEGDSTTQSKKRPRFSRLGAQNSQKKDLSLSADREIQRQKSDASEANLLRSLIPQTSSQRFSSNEPTNPFAFHSYQPHFASSSIIQPGYLPPWILGRTSSIYDLQSYQGSLPWASNCNMFLPTLPNPLIDHSAALRTATKWSPTEAALALSHLKGQTLTGFHSLKN